MFRDFFSGNTQSVTVIVLNLCDIRCKIVLFGKAPPATQLRGCVTRPGDVSSRKVGDHPPLSARCFCLLRQCAARSPLTMSGAGGPSALLFVWIVCGVAGSAEAQAPAPASSEGPRFWSANTPAVFAPVRVGPGRSHMTGQPALWIITRKAIIKQKCLCIYSAIKSVSFGVLGKKKKS